MKRKLIIVLSFVVLGFASMQAQSSGDTYLPKAGTVALGASTNIANMFFNFAPDPTTPALCAKFYVLDNMAVRATFGINSINKFEKFYVQDDAAFVEDPLSNKQVVDTKKTLTASYNSSIAIQQFFGESKLRGFIGLQGLYISGSGSFTNVYANPMNAINPTPSSQPSAYSGSARLLESKTETVNSMGAGVIAGFEYFVLPHLSIGGEISLNAIYTTVGQSSTKSETVVNGEVVIVDRAINAGGTELNIKTLGYGHRDFGNQIGVYIMYNF
jgi:hypothetical protein